MRPVGKLRLLSSVILANLPIYWVSSKVPLLSATKKAIIIPEHPTGLGETGINSLNTIHDDDFKF